MGNSLEGKKILLGITGGIAAYKSVYLLRLLKQRAADVQVVMTEAACEFVAPLTFETLSGRSVHVRMFKRGDSPESPVEHIALARWPDVAVIAPATANTISKFAYGTTDDLLSAVISAYTGAVVLAPAMNDRMWANDAVRENIARLGNRGFRVIPPGQGELACKEEGAGRMAEPEEIAAFLENMYSGALAGMKVLVSAGRTEEDLDPVRFISNRSSGKMGFALAAAARDQGADVTVVAGRVSAPAPEGVRLVRVRTAAEMTRELRSAFLSCRVLVMAAAVGDFTVAKPFEQKHKGNEWTITFTRTEDILGALGAAKGKRFIIGFALETEN
ncbi:MAG: bifunctional phosphopantothenoylcysteine decarboxylase/phosphopantothenate--cysteine ligase CoaBC, partial [Chitinivibrionia bacterium]|nr:bifunctional phosphopantothenoylcysteine decarboxylase/phosphopantothenate--cysteine ligase CoaBC [Chitinivibrionia bacterium]